MELRWRSGSSAAGSASVCSSSSNDSERYSADSGGDSGDEMSDSYYRKRSSSSASSHSSFGSVSSDHSVNSSGTVSETDDESDSVAANIDGSFNLPTAVLPLVGSGVGPENPFTASPCYPGSRSPSASMLSMLPKLRLLGTGTDNAETSSPRRQPSLELDDGDEEDERAVEVDGEISPKTVSMTPVREDAGLESEKEYQSDLDVDFERRLDFDIDATHSTPLNYDSATSVEDTPRTPAPKTWFQSKPLTKSSSAHKPQVMPSRLRGSRRGKGGRSNGERGCTPSPLQLESLLVQVAEEDDGYDGHGEVKHQARVHRHKSPSHRHSSPLRISQPQTHTQPHSHSPHITSPVMAGVKKRVRPSVNVHNGGGDSPSSSKKAGCVRGGGRQRPGRSEKMEIDSKGHLHAKAEHPNAANLSLASFPVLYVWLCALGWMRQQQQEVIEADPRNRNRNSDKSQQSVSASEVAVPVSGWRSVLASVSSLAPALVTFLITLDLALSLHCCCLAGPPERRSMALCGPPAVLFLVCLLTHALGYSVMDATEHEQPQGEDSAFSKNKSKSNSNSNSIRSLVDKSKSSSKKHRSKSIALDVQASGRDLLTSAAAMDVGEMRSLSEVVAASYMQPWSRALALPCAIGGADMRTQLDMDMGAKSDDDNGEDEEEDEEEAEEDRNSSKDDNFAKAQDASCGMAGALHKSLHKSLHQHVRVRLMLYTIVTVIVAVWIIHARACAAPPAWVPVPVLRYTVPTETPHMEARRLFGSSTSRRIIEAEAAQALLSTQAGAKATMQVTGIEAPPPAPVFAVTGSHHEPTFPAPTASRPPPLLSTLPFLILQSISCLAALAAAPPLLTLLSLDTRLHSIAAHGFIGQLRRCALHSEQAVARHLMLDRSWREAVGRWKEGVIGLGVILALGLGLVAWVWKSGGCEAEGRQQKEFYYGYYHGYDYSESDRSLSESLDDIDNSDDKGAFLSPCPASCPLLSASLLFLLLLLTSLLPAYRHLCSRGEEVVEVAGRLYHALVALPPSSRLRRKQLGKDYDPLLLYLRVVGLFGRVDGEAATILRRIHREEE